MEDLKEPKSDSKYIHLYISSILIVFFLLIALNKKLLNPIKMPLTKSHNLFQNSGRKYIIFFNIKGFTYTSDI